MLFSKQSGLRVVFSPFAIPLVNFELREERVRARPASRRVFLYNVQARRGVSFNLIETRCTVLLVVLVRLGILHESYMMYELVLYTGMYACINKWRKNAPLSKGGWFHWLTNFVVVVVVESKSNTEVRTGSAFTFLKFQFKTHTYVF